MASRYTQPLQNESVVCSGSPFTTTNNDFYTALYPANIYELAALYIINIKIRLTTKKYKYYKCIHQYQKAKKGRMNKNKNKNKKKGRRSKVP